MSGSEGKTRPFIHPEPPQRKPTLMRLWAVGLIVLAIGGYFSPSVYNFLRTLYRSSAHPREFLYQNQTLSEVANRSTVIQPLINKDQTFDIAVSVWVRATSTEELEWKNSLDDDTRPDYLRWFDAYDNRNDHKQLYHPLYSDVVFRGLRLSDKGIYASVNFTLPTEKFREYRTDESSLLGTFVLIPTSPSLMASVVNYSSYIPDEVWNKHPAVRTWPFPMGSEFKGEKTLQELAIESFSLQTPLIQFHDVPSRCPKSTGSMGVANDETLFSISHPHVTTWSQLRVVDETHIMNLESYNKLHEELKETSCGRGIFYDTPLRRYCKQPYTETGNLETRLELEIKDSEGAHTEWAYAPYMTVFPSASGPMDLIPVPVDQEDCRGQGLEPSFNSSTFNFAESDFMNVTWHITFSGRTPIKLQIGDMAIPHTVDHTLGDHEQLTAQEVAEVTNGILGFHKPDAHPLRRTALSIIEWTLTIVSRILEPFYWATRSNTVYISIPGALFTFAMGLSTFLVSLVSALPAGLAIAPEDMQISFMTFVFGYLHDLPFLYLILSTALRFNLVWRGWTPTFTRYGPTHKERASERLDATTSWATRFLLFFSLFLCLHVGDRFELIPSSLPNPSRKPTSNHLEIDWYNVHDSLQTALWATGLISQIILNHKSGYLAGEYKTVSFLVWLNSTIGFLHYVPGVVGKYQTRSALTLSTIVDWCIKAGMAYQAMTLPAVESVGSDEDDQ
ncbi:hypothetical protein D9758_008147 [Tetrapyrgos nigripes]|uniref:Uncharacterized protein n=1 Tax=Tetrapyrgos nigripes TaxID=182062 RepID=A0A8H5GHG0_9AGAR|nr:hypothetical protein D9758_008147 [Tetrapyrgos nigripes]